MSSVSTQRSILICTSPRSGSYHLCDLLGAAGEMPLPDEWMTDVFQRALVRDWGLPKDIDRLEFIRELVRRKTDANGIFAVKLMGWNFRELIDEMRAYPQFARATPRAILEDLFPHPSFLQLSRRDTLKQAVSFARAQQSGHWLGDRRKPVAENPTLVYNYSQIQRAHRSCLQSDRAWEAFFAASAIEPFRCVYEELVQTREETVARIHAFLDLPPENLTEHLRPFAEKPPYRDDLNARWLERYKADHARLVALRDAKAPVPSFVAGNFTLEIEQPQLVVEAEHPSTLKVRLTNQSEQTYTGAEPDQPDGDGWVLLEGEVPGLHGLCPSTPLVHYNLLPPLAPGETLEAEFPVPPIAQPGEYACEVVVAQRRDGVLVPLSNAVACRFAVHAETLSRVAARGVFPDLQAIFRRRAEVAWFGTFFDNEFPWIYHDDHEWIEMDPEGCDEHSVRAYDPTLGWVRISRTARQQWHREDSAEDLIFLHRSGTERHFQKTDPGEMVSFPTNDAAAAERSLTHR